MTDEEYPLSLVLQQQGESQQSVAIDPLAERQRLCFDNISPDQEELSLHFRNPAGAWRDGFIHLYRISLVEQRGAEVIDVAHYDDPDEILEGHARSNDWPIISLR